jgi:hypothetical protein
VLFAITVAGLAWTGGQSKSTEVGLVRSHEKRITDNTGAIKVLDKRQDNTEKMQISLQKDQQAILRNQSKFEIQQGKFSDRQLEQIKATAELTAYLKSIDNIKPSE